MTDLLTIPVVTADGKETTLAEHKGKVLLIVNVASRCGLAPQYAELEALQKKYADRGFTVLGFPSNQYFQELSDNDAIAQYCSTTWGVTFPIYDKIRVNGKNRAPLYGELVKAKDERGMAGNIRWNFEKFLIGKDGKVLKRFGSDVEPSSPELLKAIEEALK